MDHLAKKLEGEFCWAPSFDPQFLSALIYEGFLPMANRVAGSRKYCVLPKIHSHRSVIKLATALRIRKKTRQKCVGLQVSIDHNFEGVVAGCIKQHGHSWLYPPLIRALREMHTKGPITPMGHSGTDGAKVQVHSVEVVDKQGRLVAGIIIITTTTTTTIIPYHITDRCLRIHIICTVCVCVCRVCACVYGTVSVCVCVHTHTVTHTHVCIHNLEFCF